MANDTNLRLDTLTLAMVMSYAPLLKHLFGCNNQSK